MSRRSIGGERGDDRGSTLVLVLLLVVIAGLVVVPLMTYAASVLRLNTAVSERSKDVEAAKAGLHVALSDPLRVFSVCDDGGTLESVPLNGVSVATTCQELEEIGPLDALGFQVPIGAVATQYGAPVPTIAAGGSAESPSVPPYPDASACSGAISTGCWWAPRVPAFPDEPWDAVDGRIWMPELPQVPSETRTPTPFDMPDVDFYTTDSGIRCKVFFPGYYPDEVVLGNDGGAAVYYYFASGVYYFEESVTVRDDADVVVGMGLENFSDAPRPDADRSFCASDYEMNQAIGAPALKEMGGGGATWVFGDGARLIVDDSTGSPSIRFNQRYAEEDGGGRISIMSVNGVANGPDADVHDVPNVNYVRESSILETIDDDNDVSIVTPIDGTAYTPSNPTYTDAARLPEAPSVSLDGRRYRPSSGSSGSVLVTWDELIGNAAGGTLVDGFEVEWRRLRPPFSPTAWQAACDADGDIVHIADAGPGGSDQHACYITRLRHNRDHEVRVRARNAVGLGPWTVEAVRTASSPRDAVPDAPIGVTLEETDVDDVARVSWTPGASPDVPITGYEVVVERLDAGTTAEFPPVTWNGRRVKVEVVGTAPVLSRVPIVDPNGRGPLLVFFDRTALPPGWFVDTDPFNTGNEIEIEITPPTSGAPTDEDDEIRFDIPYTVFDVDGDFTDDVLRVEWLEEHDEDQPDAKTFDAHPEPGRPWVAELPIIDPQGRPVSVIDLDTSNFDLAEWTFDLNPTPDGTELTITTTASAPTPGTSIPLNYTVRAGGETDVAGIDVFVPVPGAENRGSCTVDATPWFPTELSCEIAGLTDLTDPADVGYQARVEAISPAGNSPAATSPAPHPMRFDGGGTASPAPPVRIVDPWTPEPIIDIRNNDPNHNVTVRINGYVAVPMGRIRIDNPEADENDRVEIVGGVIAGTYDLVDPNDDDTIIGFFNDIVLQRKIRIVSTAGSITSTAVVQINEDSTYRINSWVVN